MTRTNLLVPVTGLVLLAALGRWPSAAAAPAGALVPTALDTITRRYEVQLAYVGYTGLATSEDCAAKVDPQGYDSLVGTLTGIEPTGRSGDPVTYTGILRRKTRIDYCQDRGRRSDNDDERVWCVATLVGAAQMSVELTVEGDADQGAYLKAEPDSASRPDSVRVSGTCSQPDMNEIRAAYPGGESGGSPDGQPIGETAPPRFVVGGIPRLRVGYFPPDPRQGGWGLRVVRGTP